MGLLVGSMIVRFDSDKSCVCMSVLWVNGERRGGERRREVWVCWGFGVGG